MKKLIKAVLSLLIIAGILLGYLSKPNVVNAAKEIDQSETLGDLKKSLKEYERQYNENKNKKKKTQSEINANMTKAYNTEKELMETKEEIASIEEQITKTNEDIEKLKKETEDLLIEYQKRKSENVYVSYVTGASSITELMMRIDAINQITDYNNERLNNLELLIKNNEKKSKSLDEYKVVLGQKILAYQASISELQDEMAELDEGAVTIADEIANLKEWITLYQDMGCKDDQPLSVFINATDNAKWLKGV